MMDLHHHGWNSYPQKMGSLWTQWWVREEYGGRECRLRHWDTGDENMSFALTWVSFTSLWPRLICFASTLTELLRYDLDSFASLWPRLIYFALTSTYLLHMIDDEPASPPLKPIFLKDGIFVNPVFEFAIPIIVGLFCVSAKIFHSLISVCWCTKLDKLWNNVKCQVSDLHLIALVT